MPKNVTPATQAATEFMQATPAGTVPMTLRPPNGPTPPPQPMTPPCGADPKTGQAYRFNPQTGQPCDGLPQERIVVRQPNAIRTRQSRQHRCTKRLLKSAGSLQLIKKSSKRSWHPPVSAPQSRRPFRQRPQPQPTSNDVSPVEALGRALGARQSGDSAASGNGRGFENDYDSQNMQSRKEAFLAASRDRHEDDYLRSSREAPLSRYEIKAGWEIPAVLEQSLNSDLPGELKALVTSNVYDTATGLYLLIPQGSRSSGDTTHEFPTVRMACRWPGAGSYTPMLPRSISTVWWVLIRMATPASETR